MQALGVSLRRSDAVIPGNDIAILQGVVGIATGHQRHLGHSESSARGSTHAQRFVLHQCWKTL
jgi:hypothetical protein